VSGCDCLFEVYFYPAVVLPKAYDTMNEISSSERSYIVYLQPPTSSLDVQPDDGLLEADTYSC